MCHFNQDYGIEATWNFWATSHGKGPWDGIGKRFLISAWFYLKFYIGGQIKRCTNNAISQEKNIRKPKDVFLYAKETFKKINIHWVPKEIIENEAIRVQSRFDSARLISGTQKLHSYEPISENMIRVKKHTSSSEFRDVFVS